jgi:hypothetical protein
LRLEPTDGISVKVEPRARALEGRTDVKTKLRHETFHLAQLEHQVFRMIEDILNGCSHWPSICSNWKLCAAHACGQMSDVIVDEAWNNRRHPAIAGKQFSLGSSWQRGMFAELIFDGAFENSLRLVGVTRSVLSHFRLTNSERQRIKLTASLAI